MTLGDKVWTILVKVYRQCFVQNLRTEEPVVSYKKNFKTFSLYVKYVIPPTGPIVTPGK